MSIMSVICLCVLGMVSARPAGYIPPVVTSPHPRFMHPQVSFFELRTLVMLTNTEMRVDWAKMFSDAALNMQPAAGWYVLTVFPVLTTGCNI
jgi:hypothetical protein